jgi:hypothetical protein
VTRTRIVLGLLVLVVAAQVVEAQFGRRGGRTFLGSRGAQPDDIDGGRFQFCRIAYSGGGWTADYPRADINLSIRLAELTKTGVSFSGKDRPNYLTLQLSDAALFGCPFIMMTEVHGADLTDREVAQLREYLLKGGFLWVDDFWGEAAWEWWEAELRRVLPAAEFPIIDLDAKHPLYSSQFVIKETPQIASIQFWYRNGGNTSERGAESADVHTRGIVNTWGHLMVLMTHNTDLGDSFEREADDPQYFYTMSVPGYAFGVNTLLYALTH